MFFGVIHFTRQLGLPQYLTLATPKLLYTEKPCRVDGGSVNALTTYRARNKFTSVLLCYTVNRKKNGTRSFFLQRLRQVCTDFSDRFCPRNRKEVRIQLILRYPSRTNFVLRYFVKCKCDTHNVDVL